MNRYVRRMTIFMVVVTFLGIAFVAVAGADALSPKWLSNPAPTPRAWSSHAAGNESIRKAVARESDMSRLRGAAIGGSAAAQAKLGLLYADGVGVPVDYARAAHWFRQAAAQGHSVAQQYLATLYEVGVGVPRDYARAAEIWEKLARRGSAIAQYKLGVLYERGLGVTRDRVRAYSWATIAANTWTDDSRTSVQRAAANLRWLIGRKMSPKEVAEAETMARTLRRVIADNRERRQRDGADHLS